MEFCNGHHFSHYQLILLNLMLDLRYLSKPYINLIVFEMCRHVEKKSTQPIKSYHMRKKDIDKKK